MGGAPPVSVGPWPQGMCDKVGVGTAQQAAAYQGAPREAGRTRAPPEVAVGAWAVGAMWAFQPYSSTPTAAKWVQNPNRPIGQQGADDSAMRNREGGTFTGSTLQSHPKKEKVCCKVGKDIWIVAPPCYFAVAALLPSTPTLCDM